MTKTEIAGVLNAIGTLLELKGENPFKIRAYLSGARLLEDLGEEEIAQRVKDGTLDEIKGIGEALAQKIGELHTTGRLEFYEQLKASVPAGLVELLTIPGLGAKKVRVLQDKLGVNSIETLRVACFAGKVAALDGFGEKSQDKILSGIANREAYGRRHLWIDAQEAGAPILAGLRELPEVLQAESCGSLRRRMETVGDLDFLVATTQPGPVVAWFVGQEAVREVTAEGGFKASVRLKSGLQADLRLVPPEQFVFTLHHLTGSKEHNVQMRQRALERGLSLSEWGLFPSDEKHGASGSGAASSEPGAGSQKPASSSSPQTLAPSTPRLITSEPELFAALGLGFIPPELREGRGEIEAAELEVADREGARDKGGEVPRDKGQVTREGRDSKGQSSKTPKAKGGQSSKDQGARIKGGEIPKAKEEIGANVQVSATGLPRLIEESDIRGVFHNHTTASDGHNTLEEMVAAAEALGLEYLGIADHSKSSVQARGLDEPRLLTQIEAIRKLNAAKKFKTWVFSGTECDILPDGRLDFPGELLGQLDYVVASIHSSFKQDREMMTRRLIKAMESGRVTMLAHLTGRLLLEREPYEVDVDQITDAAVANGVAIEINANPMRLDMDWRHWRKAAEKGVLTSINPDAHRTKQLAFYRLGVGVARKGWLTKANVLNTKPLQEMKEWMKARV